MANPRSLGDLYEELGVPRGATRDEVAAAFRARAKELHPDARPDDAGAAEQFKRVGAAYRILSDPVERARYDADVLARTVAFTPVPPAAPVARSGGGAPRAPVPARRAGFRLTRRGARWAVVGGAALIVLGVLAGVFVVGLQRHDAELRAHGVATVATVVSVGGERRLEFTVPDGRVVRAAESVKSGEEQPAVGARVPIHYDRGDPTNIVTNDPHTGRNITLWIVTVKFVIGGAVLLWFGVRALRRA